jgi:hypothetical protein
MHICPLEISKIATNRRKCGSKEITGLWKSKVLAALLIGLLFLGSSELVRAVFPVY